MATCTRKGSGIYQAKSRLADMLPRARFNHGTAMFGRRHHGSVQICRVDLEAVEN